MTVIALIPYDGGFLLASDSRATLQLDRMEEPVRHAWFELLGNDFGVERPEKIKEVYLYTQKIRSVADGIVVSGAGLDRLDMVVEGVIAAHADELRDSSVDIDGVGAEIESDVKRAMLKNIGPSVGNANLAVLLGTIKRDDGYTAAFEIVIGTDNRNHITTFYFNSVPRYEFIVVGPRKGRKTYSKVADEFVKNYGYDPNHLDVATEFEAQVIAYRLVKLGEKDIRVGDPIEMCSTAHGKQLWMETDNLLSWGEKVYLNKTGQKVKIGAWTAEPSKIEKDGELEAKIRAAAELKPTLFRLNKDILADATGRMDAKEFCTLIDDIRIRANEKLRHDVARRNNKPEMEKD